MSVSAASKGVAATGPEAEVIHVAEGAPVVTLPAGSDLGGADYARHGSDLEIVLPNGQHIVIPDFFDGSGGHALATADGQMLPADLVARLAGPLAPGQFAQAEGGAAGAGLTQIGVVDKYSGTVTVRHADGTTSVVKAGDPIYQGDIVETAHGGAVGIVLADRSTFALGSEGRLVMDELVYDPATKDGHANLSVMKGSFSFISGQIAHAAPDAMQVRTPVMTIGVRGTTVAGQVGENGQTSVALVGDVGGGTGQIVVSNAGGTQVLSQPNSLLTVSSAFNPIAPPSIVAPSVISATFGSAITNLPVPPANNSLEWNTTPGNNQPAPTQQIQSRPEAGATIQVDHPGGSQVVPAGQQQQQQQQEQQQGPAEQQQQTPQQDGSTGTGQPASQTAAAEGGAQGEAAGQQAAAQGEQAAGQAQGQGAAENASAGASGADAAGAAGQAGNATGQEGGTTGTTGAGATGTTGTGATGTTGTGATGTTGTGATGTTGTGTTGTTGAGTTGTTGTGATGNPGGGTGTVGTVGNGNPGGGTGTVGNGNPGGGSFIWYSPTPPIPGSAPKPVETISTVIQNSPASNSAANETATSQGSGVSSTGASSSVSSSSGTSSTATTGTSAGTAGDTTTAAKAVVQETTSGGTDPVAQVISGGTSSSGTTGTGTGGVGTTTGTGTGTTTTPSSTINTGTTTTTGNTTTTTPTSTSGRLVDGPVSGAQVFLDINGDGQYQSGTEPVGVTDGNGYYTISGAGNYAIIALPGGTDTVTGQTISFTMKAPPGSTVVSPLTTLVAEVGEAKVKQLLGITSTASLLTTDPTTATEIYAAGIQVVATINAMKNGLGLTQEQVMTALKTAMTNTSSTSSGFLTNTTTLTSVVTAAGGSAPYANFLNDVSTAAANAQSAATSGGSIADIINPAPIDGVGNVNLTSATAVAANIAALIAANVKVFTLSSGAGTITAAQAAQVEFNYTGVSGVTMTVSDTAANIQVVAGDFDGVTAIVITDSNPVYYGVADHATLAAITTPASQVGWYLVDGDDVSAQSTVKLVKIEAGATVVMTADQINMIGQMTQVAPESWLLTKGAGAVLVAEIAGNVSGMLLGYADKFLLTADSTIGKADFVAKEILKDGFALTVDGGSYAGIFSGVDLSAADYIKWGGNVIAIHDGDALQTYWSDVASAGISTFHLTSGSVELSYAAFGASLFTTENGATVTVSDTAGVVLPYVADLKNAGVTDLNFTGDATLTIADLSALSDNFDGHFTAVGVVTLVAGDDLSAVVADFSLVDAINLSANVTFSAAQYATLMNNDVTVNTLGFQVTLNGVSGTLSLSAAEIAQVDQLILSWDVTVSEDQFAALVANAVVIVKDGSGGPFWLMLEASGTLSMDAADLAGIDQVILTGDLTLTPEQYAALVAGGATFDIGAGEHLYVASTSTPQNDMIEAVDGGSVQFHGDMLDYRFTGGNGSIIVDDLRLKTEPDHDGTDIITGANMVMGAFALNFADASVDVTSGDYIAQLRFGDGNTTARIGDGLDVVMFEGGDDTMIVEQGPNIETYFDYYGQELNGGDGTDTIQAEGWVDLSGADLYSFEKLKSGANGAVVTLSAAQFADLQIDGSGGETTVVVDGVDLSGANVVNWGSDDYLQAMGHVSVVETFIGSAYNDLFELGSGDAASGGAGNDVYAIDVGTEVRSHTFDADIRISDSSGTDILDVTGMSAAPQNDYYFRGATRDGADLVLHMDDSLGGGDIVLVDFYTTGSITKILSEMDGTDPYTYLVKGLVGTVKDEMIVGTSASEILSGGGGWDDFYGDGGNDTFIGGGKASVNYSTLTTFNAATGGLIMTGALNASGDGSATLFDGTSSWTQTYQGIAEIIGTDGNDTLYGSSIDQMDGRFSLEGGKGDDQLYDGGLGTTVASYENSSTGMTVTLSWDAANSQYQGNVAGGSGAGNDVTHGIMSFVGSAFNDSFYGSDGNESFQGGAGYDTVSGGAGFDTIAFWNTQQSVMVDLGNGTVLNDGYGYQDVVSGIEQVFGSKYNDIIMGDANANWLSGQDGGDLLTGGAGADKFTYDANTNSIAANYDTITDFGNGLDTVDLWGADGYAYNASVAVGSPADLTEALTSAYAAMAANSIGFFTFGGDGYLYVKGAGTGSKGFDGTLICLQGVTTAPSYSGYGTLLATVVPTEGSDQLVGTSGNDTISALGGDDTIYYSGGADSLDGGSGSDTLDFSGAYTGVTGGFLTNTVSAGGNLTTFSNVEVINGSTYADVLYGAGVAGKQLYGAGGNDTFYAGEDNNVFHGGDGNDSFTANEVGGSTFYGDAGNDIFYAQSAATATFDGGDGIDLVDFSNLGFVTVDLQAGTAVGEGTDTLISIEAVRGSAYGDTLFGSSADETLYGMAGADTLDGGAGNDTLNGGLGADQIWGGDGNDAFILTSASDSTITDTDLIGDFGTGSDTLTLTGAAGYTYVAGFPHGGGAIADVIADVYTNMDDNQVAYFTWELDAYLIVKGAGTGTSYDQTLVQLPNLGLAPTYLGSGVFQSPVFGTAGDDEIIGTSGVDVIDGGDGADIITGNGGDDTILGGFGADTITIGSGDDFVDGGDGADTITADGGANLLFGGSGNDVITGGVGADVIDGGMDDDILNGSSGLDTLIGGMGGDQLTGGADSDTFVFNTADEASDVITDFTAGAGGDVLKLGLSLSYNGSGFVQSAASNDTIQPDVAVVLVTTNAADCSNLPDVEAVINTMDMGERSMVFVVGDAYGNSALWYKEWVVSEVNYFQTTKIVELTGVTPSQMIAANFMDIHGQAFSALSLSPSANADLLFGDAGANAIDGLAGDDVIYGLGGADTLTGGDGDDAVITVGAATGSTLAGGAGGDILTVIGEADMAVDGISLSGFESIVFEDVNAQSNAITSVTISAAVLAENYASVGGGFEVLKMDGMQAGLVVDLGTHGDVVDIYDNMYVSGFNTLVTDGSANAGGISATVLEGFMTQSIVGGSGNDQVEMAAFVGDPIYGGDQSVRITFNDGDDILYVTGGSSKSNVDVSGGNGYDKLVFSTAATLGTAAQHSVVSGIEELDLSASTTADAIAYTDLYGTGGDLQVTIKLSDGALGQVRYNTLDWDAGDSLNVVGSASADTFFASVGNDTLNGGAGNDTLVGNGGNDQLTGGADADQFLFYSSAFDVAALGTDIITDFSSAQGDTVALSVATFSGLGSAGPFADGTDYFESSTLQSSYGSGAGIIVVGDSTGTGGVSLYYAADLSDTSQNSYQIATIQGVNTNDVAATDFTKSAVGA
ncbi:hypothetical protein [Magnetospirillum sp. 64-120]|uniref:M10 family metallopeptidase C-terminal domain-containing protein n=1 Tax=Magnetospirillum sp. 64-120 TaxID=1895778 RepID=UPI000929CBB3|nr:hypothetical protein [Magnetospirillum sp. 64-120]OJX70395.1 MAG: hypothetical protein BGO92_17555 [Magnetospirillum sp. 64-120]